MSQQNKSAIKLNKKHQGKEFSNSFRFIGQVKPVRKKEAFSENWIDIPYYQVTTTQSKKERRVLQFSLETAFRNELKLELAGMVKDNAYAYSRKHNSTVSVDWDDRKDKSKLPDETYHVMTQEWDQTEELSKIIDTGIWVDVRGKYEFETMMNEEGKEFKLVKRIITHLYPLKNGEVEVKGLKENDLIRVYDSKTEGIQLGYGKASKEGIATIKVGWLNPEGGVLFVCKVDGDNESNRSLVEYNEGETVNERITVRNNVDSEISIDNADGDKEKITYKRDFNSPEFVEINTYKMQIGILSTYQDDSTKDTKVNAVFLGYGKERSVPKDVELTVYFKEPDEGRSSLADAFARLNRLDFMEVTGIDNNRATFAMIDVEDTDDNPFADVEEKTTRKERVATGTKKGLEILSYVNGSYVKELLTEEEITKLEPVINRNESSDPFGDPFASAGKPINISDDDLPF
jgi:hypothetical protein